MHFGATVPHAEYGRLCVIVQAPGADPLLRSSKCLPSRHTAALAGGLGRSARFELQQGIPGSSVHTALLEAGGELRTHTLALPALPGSSLAITAAGEGVGAVPAAPTLTLLAAV